MPDPTSAVSMERRRTAVVSTAVAGDRRLMGQEKEAAIRTITIHRALFASPMQHYRDRMVDAPGANLVSAAADTGL
jgi:hypothetical protein